MSTTTLSVNAGTFAAVSVTLLGVTRLDTGSPVTFGGSAFTNGGGGNWTYVLTDPASPAPVYKFLVAILQANGQTFTFAKRSGTGLVDVNVISVSGQNVQQAAASLIGQVVNLTNESVTLTPG